MADVNIKVVTEKSDIPPNTEKSQIDYWRTIGAASELGVLNPILEDDPEETLSRLRSVLDFMAVAVTSEAMDAKEGPIGCSLLLEVCSATVRGLEKRLLSDFRSANRKCT